MRQVHSHRMQPVSSPSDAPSSQPSVGRSNQMRQAHIHVPARSHRMCEAHSHLLGQVLSCQPSDAPSSSHRMRQVPNHLGAAIRCAKLTSMYQPAAIECVTLTAICWGKFSAVSHRMRQVHRIGCAKFLNYLLVDIDKSDRVCVDK
jgi:hypothetical protein